MRATRAFRRFTIRGRMLHSSCKHGYRKCGAATLAAATSQVALWRTLQRAGGHFSARNRGLKPAPWVEAHGGKA